MNAALGISQLAALESFVAARREVAAAYAQSLLKSRHKSLVQKIDAENVLSSFPVALADGMKDVRQYALKKNVDTVARVCATSIAALEESAAPAPLPQRPLPGAALPAFPAVPDAGKRDVEAVCRVLATLP